MTAATLTLSAFLEMRFKDDEQLAREGMSPRYSGGQYGLSLGRVVLALAAPYADHPDWNEAWA